MCTHFLYSLVTATINALIPFLIPDKPNKYIIYVQYGPSSRTIYKYNTFLLIWPGVPFIKPTFITTHGNFEITRIIQNQIGFSVSLYKNFT